MTNFVALFCTFSSFFQLGLGDVGSTHMHDLNG